MQALADEPAPAEPSLFEAGADQKLLSEAAPGNELPAAERKIADTASATTPAALTEAQASSAVSSRRKPPDVAAPFEEAAALPDKENEKVVAPLAAQPIDEATQPAQNVAADVRPSSFQDVTPGVTTVDELRAQHGAPAEELRDGETTVLHYKIGPFEQVSFVADGAKVRSIVIGLKDSVDSKSVAAELQLTALRPAPIYDEQGQLLGAAFAERGVIFSYAPQQDRLLVEQIILDPIGAEPFLLRAQHDNEKKFGRTLADLDTALELEPQNAPALWLKAELLAELEEYAPASEAAAAALRLAPENPRYQLTRARLMSKLNEPTQALDITAAVAADQQNEPLVRALAELQQGDLLASPASRDFRQALEHHLAAIKLAAPLGNEPGYQDRRLAKQILVDAHLAAALDIAAGQWQEKESAAAKWLENGRKLAAGMLEHEQSHPLLMLTVERKTLEAYASLGGHVQSATTAQVVLRDGAKLLEDADDELYAQHVKWELAAALLAAAQAEHARDQYESAGRFAEQAVKLVEPLVSADDETAPHRKLLVARCCFMAGAAHAAQGKDYAAAAKWYARSAPVLIKHTQHMSDFTAAADGQKLVSMGVALWRQGNRETALEWTRTGVAQMERGVQAGQIDKQLLAVPYNNLAAMNDSLGNSSAAAALAAKAKSLQVAADNRR